MKMRAVFPPELERAHYLILHVQTARSSSPRLELFLIAYHRNHVPPNRFPYPGQAPKRAVFY